MILDPARQLGLLRFPLGRATELVYFPADRTALLLSVEEAEKASLAQFATPAPSRGSGWSTRASTPDARLRPARQNRTRLEELLGRSALPRHGPALQTGRKFVPGISWLAIPTRGRPALLRRAVGSHLASLGKWGLGPSILVVDDEDAEGSVPDRALQGLGKGRDLLYAGLRERRLFASALVGGGKLPKEVVAFGLLGSGCGNPTIGAVRNTVLLATTGARVLCVDDDTVCYPACVPEVAEDKKLVLAGRGDATEFWFYPSRREAVRSVSALDLSPLVEHARLLGGSIADVIERAEGWSVEGGLASVNLLRSLLAGKGRIRITLNGVVGDSGMYSGAALPVHTAEGTRLRLLNSEQSFLLALSSREVVRQALATTVSDCRQSMSTFIGLDNCDLLPPFSPAYRNEDGLFGLTLDACFDEVYSCHLPWALLHSPNGSRSYQPTGLFKVRISDIVAVCIGSWTGSLRSQPPDRRMLLLGGYLQELGSMSSKSFEGLLRELLRKRAFALVAQREATLVQYAGHPAYWAAHLKAQVHSLLCAVNNPAFPFPEDMPGESLKAAQAFLARFGELLYWWPALVERATEQKNAGLSLGRRVQ